MKANKMKKVLIAVDYDPTAQKVAETGFSLAKSMKADVILLHVISDPVYYSSTEYSPIIGFSGFLDMSSSEPYNFDGLKKASLYYLNVFKQQLGDKSDQIQIGEGDIAESILKTANDLHADIIIMGSHSHKWLDEILMGSITEKVLHHTSIPLFIVPTKKHK